MTTQEQKPGWLLWFVPLVSLALSYVALALPGWWTAADLDSAPVGWMRMLGTTLAFVCWGWLVVWFFGFTRVARRTKLICLSLLVLLIGSACWAIDGFTVTANLWPTFHFRWQSRPEAELARYLGETESTDGLPPIDLTIDPVNDFPRYRGLHGDGVVRPAELLDTKWEGGKPKELWRHPCGSGFSGFAVAGNVAITLEQRGEDEVVVCYDRATGKQRWAHAYPAHFKDVTGDGPRATPTIVDGEVYSYGAVGDLVCLDGRTGAKKWAVNALEDAQASNISWAMAGSPLVHEDVVIVNAGIDPKNNAGRSLVAYARKDGTRVWAGGKHKAGYSSPILATLAGKQQVLLFDAGGLAGFDRKTGEELWRHPWKTFQDMNIIQPVLFGEDRVLISSEVNNGSAMLRISRKGDEFTVSVLWENRMLASRQANPIRLGDAIFGLHNGTLVCLNARTGGRQWRGKNYGQGQMLAVAGSLLIQSERGELVVVLADQRPGGGAELGKVPIFDRRTWNTPALAGRHLYLRNDAEMVCYELPLKQ